MTDTPYCIYRIDCSISGKSYVGLTKQGVQKRFKAHWYIARTGGKTALYAAMRKYGIEAFSVSVLRDGLTLREAQCAEIALIVELATRAPQGYNLSEGGDKGQAGRTMSAETRAKMSETHRQRQQDPELRRRTSEALRGRAKSPEHLRKIAEALTGNTISEATRAKLRAANLGKVQSAETRAKRAAKLRGIKRSEETRRRMSIAQRKAKGGRA